VDERPAEEEANDGAEVEAAEDICHGARTLGLGDEARHDVCDGRRGEAFTKANKYSGCAERKEGGLGEGGGDEGAYTVMATSLDKQCKFESG
jgi:hypothetical protein